MKTTNFFFWLVYLVNNLFKIVLMCSYIVMSVYIYIYIKCGICLYLSGFSYTMLISYQIK